MPPNYDWNVFLQACSKGDVWVHGQAMKDAAEFFNLPTKDQLLNFIANSGLENIAFHNSLPYNKWPGKSPAPLIDAYRFSSGPTRKGYLAFFKSPVTDEWIIKSFHKEMQEGELNSPFSNLRKLLQSESAKEKENE